MLDDDVLNLTSPDKYELVWYLPEDNGEPIDFFEISFYPVGFDPNTQTWNRRGDLFRTEVPHPGNVRYVIQVKSFTTQCRGDRSKGQGGCGR